MSLIENSEVGHMTSWVNLDTLFLHTQRCHDEQTILLGSRAMVQIQAERAGSKSQSSRPDGVEQGQGLLHAGHSMLATRS